MCEFLIIDFILKIFPKVKANWTDTLRKTFDMTTFSWIHLKNKSDNIKPCTPTRGCIRAFELEEVIYFSLPSSIA